MKPSNILVNENCDLKICDFGLARIQDPQMTGYVSTRYYRAPEIMLTWQKYDVEVDIWSAGCIFAEMQTNRTLFPGDSEIDQIYRIFRTLGTPDETSWPGFNKLPEYRHFARFKSRGVENYIGDHDKLAVDLLSKFLAYDPVTRISCRQAMTHGYFEGAANIDLSFFQIF